MPLMTANEYIESLRKLNTRIYMFGEKIDNWVDHPMIRPSINCVAMTYELAQDPQYQDLMVVESSLTGRKVNRFTPRDSPSSETLSLQDFPCRAVSPGSRCSHVLLSFPVKR